VEKYVGKHQLGKNNYNSEKHMCDH